MRGRPPGHPVGHPGPAEQARVHHGLLHHAQRGFQPGHAERGRVPLRFLVLHRMRCVIGGHAVDGAVGQPLAQRRHVRRGAQRRVDLVDRVVAGRERVGQQQVVRGHLGGDPPALALRPADDLHRAGRGHVADVQRRADVGGEQAVPGDDSLLGHGRPAGQPEPPGHLPLVELRALGEPGFLRVLRDDPVERLHVLQCAAHQHGVGHAPPVVREHPDPGRGVGHRAEFGQPRSGQAHGDRPDRVHVAVPGLPPEPPDLFHHACGVGDRVGVGHRVHGGEAAQRRRPGAGLHGLGVLAARLAQVSVQVHEARQGDEARRVEDLGARRGSAVTDAVDHAPADQDVGGVAAQRPRALDQPGPRARAHASLPLTWSAACLTAACLTAACLTAGRLMPAPRLRRAAGTARPSAR